MILAQDYFDYMVYGLDEALKSLAYLNLLSNETQGRMCSRCET